MKTLESSPEQIWRISLIGWVLLAICIISLSAVFYDGLSYMVHRWSNSEEYGYGYLIPILTIFFIWQKKSEIEIEPFNGSWSGVFIVLVGILFFILGELSTLYIIVQYSFLVALCGFIIAAVGWKVFRIIWVPLLFLVFMIPLPNFIYQGLSAQLQLISSELGVAFIRLFDISVYLEGNVIDLGTYQLQVVEACSGLRYLFPLAALSFMAAYIFKAPFWMRAVVFLSSIPITIFMNSLRIGIIGILVNTWGTSQAEGFIHYFEGWIIFMACMVILILEIWALTKIGNKNYSLRDSFALDFPEPPPSDAVVYARKIQPSLIAAVVLIVLSVPISASIEQRQEILPERIAFSQFPMTIGEWTGQYDRIDQIYLDVLKLDDHIIADYVKDKTEHINFFAAYYASQSKGESAHSPRSCIPGGGWQIKSLTKRTVEGAAKNGMPLRVNRVEIRKGDYRQIVYYWFQGRSRIITNEYMVKWFLFWDALIKKRTDGALVRLTAFVATGEDVEAADQRLSAFASEVSPHLDSYIPK